MKSDAPGSFVLSLIATLLALASCAVPQPAQSQALHARSGAYALEVLVDGTPVRTFAHAGETYVLGRAGTRYVLRIHNRSARRIEAVVSVDGLDVIDGEPADFEKKRGYLVPAYGFIDIDGWRLSQREAAAFRFAAIADSYAAKTGSARNVGVIGVAVFPERYVPRPIARPPYAPRSDDAAPEGSTGHKTERKSSAPPRVGNPGYGSGSAEIGDAPAASAAPAPSAESARARRGLGTEFGEAVRSEIREVAFVRASTRPAALLGARYDDRAGLVALGIDVDGTASDIALRQSAQPFPASSRRFAQPPADWRQF